MHLLVVLVLVVGTFLYFPRLAKVLVGLALVGLLVGGLAIAGTLLYQEYVVRPAKEAAATKAAAEAERLRREALAATPAPPSLAERKAAYERWKAENARTTRRTQAIDDLRTVRYEVQDGPA